METNISLILIQRECKFSEQALKQLSKKDPKSLPPPGCYSEFTDIEEIPDVKCRMYLDVSTEKNVSYFSPRLQLSNLKNQRIRGTFAFYIKSTNYASSLGSALFQCNFKGYGPDVCTFEDLFNPEKKFVVNGECCIEMKGIFHLESLIERYFTILVGKENDSKTEIKVHKCVIGARSSVFDAMLYTNMKEKTESKVEIIDFAANIVQAAVEYCYDQDYFDLLKDVTDAITLLQFSDKYNIRDLKNELEQFFVKVAKPKDICEIANASIISNSIKLRDFCIQKMIMFSKMEISIDNIEILDKDFAIELMKKTFIFKK